jgi:hypothetical protein
VTQPTQTQAQRQGHPVAQAAGAAAAIAAVQAGLPDPFLPLRLARLARFVRAERRMLTDYRAALANALPAFRHHVIPHPGVYDARGAFAVKAQWDRDLEPIVEVVLREEYQRAFEEEAHEPDTDFHVRRYLEQARNRMSRTPDAVYKLVNDATLKAATQGSSVEDLAAQVDKILGYNDVAVWKNRALSVARTELIGAVNAGQYAGMISEANQLGGEWEKGWLSTEDTRVRPTHAAADFHLGPPDLRQRVPLTAPFVVGGFPGMFPGDPELPAQETIQCRCTFLLLKPGETPDMSNRHYRELG